MKKQFFLVLLCISASMAAHAQYVWLTPKVGYSLSTQKFNDINTFLDDKNKYVSSLLFGVAVEYGFSSENKFAIQPEIYYLKKGSMQVSTYSSGNFTDEYKETYHYNFIELPVLFKYSLGDVDEKRLSFFSGPAFGYALGGKYKYEYNGDGSYTNEGKIKIGEDTRTTTNSTDTYINANRLNVGWQLGVGGNMKFGFGSLTADLRYSTGVSNFFKKGGDDYNDYGSAKMRNFIFSVGYMIPLDNK